MRISLVPLLLIASTAYAVNVSLVTPLCVDSTQAQTSSRFVQITAQANPLKGTKVDFYSYKLNSQSAVDTSTLALLFSLNTDQKGRIKTPELSPGGYCVSARGADNQFAQLLINVIPGKRARTTRFTIRLVTPPEPAIPAVFRPQWTAADEQLPIQKRVSLFRGEVKDQSGAVIPNALIDIVKKGTGGKEHVAQLKTGLDGRFFGKLPPGLYIALFCARAFRGQTIPFEITKDGSGEIDVVLDIDNTPETITSLHTD